MQGNASSGIHANVKKSLNLDNAKHKIYIYISSTQKRRQIFSYLWLNEILK